MLGVFKYDDKLGRRLVVILQGYPCAYGKCTFCPFALEQTLHPAKLLETNRRIIGEALRVKNEWHPRRIAIFNGGSLHELPLTVLEELKPLARGVVFEVEERSEYVTLDSIRHLLDFYNPDKLVIRIGFENIEEWVREKVLVKGMPDSELHRIRDLIAKVRELGLPVEIWTYVLFGMEGIPEDTVVRSVREFKRIFDGVIAIRYRRYVPTHPKPVPVSKELALILERETDLVDWGGDQWVIAGREGSAPG
ncbi:MAG: hypothetical protein GSR85_08970 [Desulfurococcales archaeon]|nr:hypothetical protein [Desulfurococcales archaeon]